MTDSSREAVTLASKVYADFMAEVVDAHVINDRTGPLPDEKKRKGQAAAKLVDKRILRLQTMSGKGGYHADPDRRASYAQSANVTLLDHLLSVVRGALTFATLDLLATNPTADRTTLEGNLRRLAAIAFLHDLDKDLGLARNDPLSLDAVAERWTRYGLDTFTAATTPALEPDQVRALIEQVEASQAHRSPPAASPPRALTNLLPYVALADKLDGLWLKEGVDAVLTRLHQDQSLRTDLARDWRAVDLFDPHHPFLVDELQRALSSGCRPVPPLIEVHQDGRLLMLIPAAQSEEIRAKALKRLRAFLARKLFQLRVNVSNRGVPELLESQPDHATLTAFMAEDLPEQDLANLFRVKAELASDQTLTHHLDALLADIGLAPTWPMVVSKTLKTLSPYPSPTNLAEPAQAQLRRAAHLALLLNHKTVKGLPNYGQREKGLMEIIPAEPPAWLTALDHDPSRRTLTALWVTRLAGDDPEVAERIWGEGGLLCHWLEGTEGGRGLRETIDAKDGRLLDAVIAHFNQRLDGQPMTALADQGRHCLFTGQPVARTDSFKEADQLYEIKKSAFSGRDGRVEALDAVLGETHISPVSYTEYRLRAQIHAGAGGRADGIPTLVSSPATTGLFAALAVDHEEDFRTLSSYDLAREEIAKGRVYRGADVYRHRYRIARFERQPAQTRDLLDWLRLLMQASRRLGRPVHLFRGLPVPEKAFFAIDSLPTRLADLLGGNRLRLEQLPHALERLNTALLILDANGLGYEVLNRYARPDTRLGAVCLAWTHFQDASRTGSAGSHFHPASRFRFEFEQLLKENAMSNTEAPLVALGRAASRIQRWPGYDASRNEELMTFNLSLETAIGAWRLGQADPASLAMAIAGELEVNLARKDLFASGKHRPEGETLSQALITFAQQFVDEVWFGVLKGRPPAQTSRRILGSIYRLSFLTAARPQSKGAAEVANA